MATVLNLVRPCGQVAMYSLVASQAVGGALTLSLEPVGKGVSSIEGRIQDISACQDATWGETLHYSQQPGCHIGRGHGSGHPG